MKKTVVLLFVLLLLPIAGGFCTDMEFYVSGGGGINAACVEGDELYHKSLTYDVNVSLLNFRFADRHTIGMPFIFRSFSETAWIDGRQLEMHHDFGVGLSYKYSFNRYIELLSQTAFYYRNYPANKGSLFGMDLTMELWLMPIEYIGLRIPFTIGFTRDEIDLSVGLGAIIRYTKENI